jgi:hypothetical protein
MRNRNNKRKKNKTIKNKSIKNKSIKNKSIKNKSIKNKSIKNKSIKNKSIKNKSIKIRIQKGGENTFESLFLSEKTIANITYNGTNFGYFAFINNVQHKNREIIYLGDTVNKYIMGESENHCISINIPNEKDIAHLDGFFYNKSTLECISKTSIKAPEFFPLFDIFVQELKKTHLSTYDASILKLKNCNYTLGKLGLLQKGYTYYNKYGFYLSDYMKPNDDTLEQIQTTNNKIKAVADETKIITIREMLNDLAKYKFDYIPSYQNTNVANATAEFNWVPVNKDDVDNIRNNLEERIQEVITIYNRNNKETPFKFTFEDLKNKNIGEFINDFLMFFCQLKDNDDIRYQEKMSYIIDTITLYSTIFQLELGKFKKSYYYEDGKPTQMTAYNMTDKQFVRQECPAYTLNIETDSKPGGITNIVITDSNSPMYKPY